MVNKGDGSFERKLEEAQHQDKQKAEAVADAQSLDLPENQPTPTPKIYICPERWEEDIELTNFALRIDADISLSQGNHPVTRVMASDFQKRADTVQKIMSLLMPQADGYREGLYCYEDYQAEAENFFRGRYDSDNKVYIPYTAQEKQEMQPRLDELHALMQTAVHKDDYQPFNDYITTEGEHSFHTENGQHWYATIRDNSLSVSREGYFVYKERSFIHDPVHPGMIAPTPFPRITIRDQDAVKTAEAFFSQLGDDSWAIVQVERAAMMKMYCNQVTDDPTYAQGYEVYCLRKNGDSPLFDYKNMGGERLIFDQAEYAATLPIESLSLFINEDGIYGLWWDNPIDIKQQLTEDIELLPLKGYRSCFYRP